MAPLVSALLVQNEEKRYLHRVLRRCLEFSDKVLVLDDRSVDGTVQVAKDLGCHVRGRSILKGSAWGNESPARAELWDWAAEEAGDGWVLFCDADMLLHGDPRPLTHSWEVNAWAFILYDLWDESEHFYRSDGFWRGHTVPRPWLVRPSAYKRSWSDSSPIKGRPIHSGHIPPDFPLHCAIAPSDEHFWLHLGYCKKPDRLLKFERYNSVATHLTEWERRHANSIMDYDRSA